MLLAAQFTAHVVYTEQGRTQTMQLAVKGQRYRIERVADGQHVVVLVDRAAHTVRVLVPALKQYHESPTSNFLVALFDPFEVPEIEAAMSEGLRRRSGTDSVDGYACQKYTLTSKDGTSPLLDYCVSPKLELPLSIAEPPPAAMRLQVRDIREVPVDDSLFAVPSGYAFVPEPGTTPPPWAKDAASAPVAAIPFSRVMSAGQAIRIRVPGGSTIQVAGSQSAAPRTQFTAVPFRDGKPAEAVMPDTFNIGRGERWAITIGPAPAGGNEIVVRVNIGRALITITSGGR